MISDQGLLYLSKDVRWLIEHVKSLGGNDSILDVFTELQQVRDPPSPSLSPDQKKSLQ